MAEKSRRMRSENETFNPNHKSKLMCFKSIGRGMGGGKKKKEKGSSSRNFVLLQFK